MASKFWNSFTTNVEKGTIEIEFFDGTKETLDVNAQSPANRAAAMWHGYVQKIRDGAAVTVYEGDGEKKIPRPGTNDEKRAGVLGVLDTLRKGVGDAASWTARSGSAGEKDRGGLDVMVDALVAYYASVNKAVEPGKVRDKLKTMTQKARVALVTSKPVIAFYRKESGETVVNVDTLLD